MSTGSFNITGGTLMLSLSNLPVAGVDGTYLLVANDGSDAIAGTFATVTGLPAGFTATVNYAFNGTDSLGRTGDGNDLAVTVVPEPQSFALLALGAPLRSSCAGNDPKECFASLFCSGLCPHRQRLLIAVR